MAQQPQAKGIGMAMGDRWFTKHDHDLFRVDRIKVHGVGRRFVSVPERGADLGRIEPALMPSVSRL